MEMQLFLNKLSIYQSRHLRYNIIIIHYSFYIIKLFNRRVKYRL